MSTEFQYPSVRVGIVRIDPISNGNCRFSISSVLFTIYAYNETEGTSKPCAVLLDGIVAAFAGSLLKDTGADFVPYRIIDLVSITPPVPEGVRFWRGEVQFQTALKEI